VFEDLDNLKFTVSTTTRQPRPQKRSTACNITSSPSSRFQQMIAAEAFAEHANVYGNWYGTSKQELETTARRVKICLLKSMCRVPKALKRLYPTPCSFSSIRQALTICARPVGNRASDFGGRYSKTALDRGAGIG